MYFRELRRRHPITIDVSSRVAQHERPVDRVAQDIVELGARCLCAPCGGAKQIQRLARVVVEERIAQGSPVADSELVWNVGQILGGGAAPEGDELDRRGGVLVLERVVYADRPSCGRKHADRAARQADASASMACAQAQVPAAAIVAQRGVEPAKRTPEVDVNRHMVHKDGGPAERYMAAVAE